MSSIEENTPLSTFDWEQEANMAVTICDKEGTIVFMNEKSKETFLKPEERTLVGKNLFKCHNEESKKKIKELMKNPKSNTYTMEAKGTKKLIHQLPWMKNGECIGMVELSIILPKDMPHHARD